MNEIRAIETSYKGYLFRSRLEATWAVFFDAVGLGWIYEPEGFVLQDGTRYLPDFYLPEIGVYAEVKPPIFPLDPQIITNMQNMSYGDKPIILLVGKPGEYKTSLYCYDLTDSSGGQFEDDDFEWGFCLDRNQLHLVAPGRERTFYADSGFSTQLSNIATGWTLRILPILQVYPEAFLAATQARFEYGQTPKFGRN